MHRALAGLVVAAAAGAGVAVIPTVASPPSAIADARGDEVIVSAIQTYEDRAEVAENIGGFRLVDA
jgi:hypothetical protein